MAGTVNLKSKISLDDSALVGGMKRVQRSVAAVAAKASKAFRNVGGSIAKAAAKMKNFAMIAGALTFGAAIAGAYKLGRALKGAFDMGGRLSDLSAQTGIAVDQLAILQQAFEDNGVEGDKVGAVMNKMQRSIVDFGAGLSTQTRAFERLGITFDQIEGKSPIEQFKMVQNAIANIQDPTLKAATAMEIFGRSGGDMLALFQDSGAIEKATVTMGSSAEILAANAEKFDRISDLLNRASVKFQGIILALAEVAAPRILEALEKFNQMDFAGIGQRFLAGINIEKAKELLIGAFKIAVAFLGNKMLEALRFAAHLSQVAFTHVFEKLSGNFGKRLMQGLREVAKIAILPPPLQIVEVTKKLKEGLKKAGEDGMTLEEKLLAAKDALKDKVTKDPDPFGFGKAVADFKDDLDDVMRDGAEKVDQKKAEEAAKKAAQAQKDIFDKAFEQGKTPTPSPEPKQATEDGLNIKRSTSVSNTAQREASRISELATKMAGAHSQGFSGLAGLHQMQLQKAQAIAVGSQGVFAKDRERLGVASGLSTGGVGAKRYANPAREAARIAKEQKKDAREQIDVLRDVDKKLERGLGLTAA